MSAVKFGWRDITGRQWAVFFAATVGYGIYYVCRLSLSVVKVPLVADGVLTEAQVGMVGSALFYVYAAGKLANGFLADHVSQRKLVSLGLLGTALVNLALGWTTAFAVFLGLWALNGWLQSMGAAPCIVAMMRWFKPNQRGTFYGLWSASHNIGEGLTFLLTSAVVAGLGWRAGFLASSLTGLLGVALVWGVFRDGPAPAAKETTATTAAGPTVASEQWQVLRNPVVWSIALASACMYVTRYAMNSWGIFYFQNGKGYAPVAAGGLLAVSSVCGVVGTTLSGWFSDVVFGGDRFKPAIGFGLLNAAAFALMLWVPRGYFAVDVLAMVVFGLAIGALVCYLGGLIAVDSVSRRAAGAALGVVGVASYVGAGTQDILSGWLIGRGRIGAASAATYDFTAVGTCWMLAAVATIAMTLLARWFHRRQIRSTEG